MPNGYDHDDTPLDIRVTSLMTESKICRDALWKAIEVVKELIKENKEIRRLARLPKGTYPKEIRIENHSWSLK